MTQNIKITNQNLMMKTMINIKKITFVFLILDIFLIVFSLYMGDIWLINTQGGFISSMIIVIGSFYGYKKTIEKQTKHLDEAIDEDRDLIDKTLDPHELWEEDDKPKTKIESIKTSFKNTKSFFPSLFSPYRLIGYFVLIALCFFLLKQNIFHPLAFFVGLISTTILISIYALLEIKAR